ncbi:MAG TPA: hypothetical protein PLG17_10215, partial [Thermodesulfobacteriota bacterium]|nr:hypothetical protein [Thermodesulfobacteriota bacterium]
RGAITIIHTILPYALVYFLRVFHQISAGPVSTTMSSQGNIIRHTSVDCSPEADPAQSAHRANLRYINDARPGYRRQRCGKGFIFFDAQGARIRDKLSLDRLTKLIIPPAWKNVWICPEQDGHIQVTGRDDRGRKQYIYHPRWEEIRNLTKFDRMTLFADVLPSIREQVDHDLNRPALSRETVLAFVVRLMDETLFRIGNSAYTRINQTYGLTTLRDWHVEISGSVLHMRFEGKRGKRLEAAISNRRLARLARQYQELPGQELLQYEDTAGQLRLIDSGDVNDYLREISGSDFTAKDFRTWGGTVFAATELYRSGPAASEREAKTKIVHAMKKTAARLGNTPTICRTYYVHPYVIDCFRDQTLFRVISQAQQLFSENDFGLFSEEKATLELIRQSCIMRSS